MQYLDLQSCLGLRKIDRLYHATPPPYSPNVVNQTVDYGGITWKGQPGQGWTAQSATGGGPVSGGGNSSFDPQQILNLAKQAQQMQIDANQPAIQTLQGQKSSLSDQYKELLNSTLQQGTVAENYTQNAQNNLLGQRGISNDSALYNTTMGSALLPVETSYRNYAANIGMGSAQDMNQLAGQIASLQTGNVPQSLSFGGNLGALQQQAALIPAQQQLLQGQARQTNYVPIPGYGIYDLNSNQLIGGLNGIPGQGVTNVNGVPSLYIP